MQYYHQQQPVVTHELHACVQYASVCACSGVMPLFADTTLLLELCMHPLPFALDDSATPLFCTACSAPDPIKGWPIRPYLSCLEW